MPSILAPLVLAAQSSSLLTKLKQIPSQTWINLALCVAAIVIISKMWKMLKGIGSAMPWVVLFIAGFMMLSYWTYNRTEPRFLSPFVDKLTLILPTKAQHDEALQNLRESRQ